MWEEMGERQRGSVTIEHGARKQRKATAIDWTKKPNVGCFICRGAKESEGEAGRESTGAGVEGTLGLAELIAVMDWSDSPEHGAPGPALTQPDDFADLHS